MTENRVRLWRYEYNGVMREGFKSLQEARDDAAKEFNIDPVYAKKIIYSYWGFGDAKS